MARPWNATAKYRKGWTGKDLDVSGGHEAEARPAQEAKNPGPLGPWILRKPGCRGVQTQRHPTSPRTMALPPPESSSARGERPGPHQKGLSSSRRQGVGPEVGRVVR